MFQTANQIVLKVTKGCNLRCKYCYVSNKDKFSDEYMSLETLKKTIDQVVFDRLKSSSERLIDITFHGGEPTKLDKKVFYNMCEYASYALGSHNIKVKFSIQTNLTLIDEEWCSILSRFNFGLGFSFDGIDNSNSMRNLFGNKFYKDKIDLIKSYGIPISCLMVVNKKNIENIENSLNYIENNFGNNLTKINYSEDTIVDFNIESEFEVSGKDYYNKFIISIINKFIETGNSNSLDIDILIEKFIISYISNKKSFYPDGGNCYIKYCGGGINVLEVEPDGSIMMCGRYGDDYPESTLDNSPDFLNAKQIKKILQFQKEKILAMNKLGCDSCQAQSICDHGCMAFYLTKSKNNNKNNWGIRGDIVCDIFKPLYNFLLLHVKDIIKAYIKYHNNFIVYTSYISAIHLKYVSNILNEIGFEIIQDNDQIKFIKKS